MKLNPGMKAEYIRRHDEIWPELVALLKDAGVSDYSIHLDEETNTLFGVLWRRSDHTMDDLPNHPVMKTLVGAYGRHHGDEARQRAGRRAARNRLPYEMSNPRHVAVIDIGKTNAKLALVDLETLSEVAVRTTPNTVLTDGLYPHFDCEPYLVLYPRRPRGLQPRDISRRDLGHHPWLRRRARRRERRARHAGARLRIRRARGNRRRICAVRPPFSETGTPRLPLGPQSRRADLLAGRRPSPASSRRFAPSSPIRNTGPGASRASPPARSLRSAAIPISGTRIGGPSPASSTSRAGRQMFAPVRRAGDRLGAVPAGAVGQARARSRRAGPLRHPRFQRLALSASDERSRAVLRRLDRNLGDRDGGRRPCGKPRRRSATTCST